MAMFIVLVMLGIAVAAIVSTWGWWAAILWFVALTAASMLHSSEG